MSLHATSPTSEQSSPKHKHKTRVRRPKSAEVGPRFTGSSVDPLALMGPERERERAFTSSNTRPSSSMPDRSRVGRVPISVFGLVRCGRGFFPAMVSVVDRGWGGVSSGWLGGAGIE